MHIHTASYVLDLFLVIFPIAAYVARPRVGGQMEKGLRVLLIGIILMGTAHLLETSIFLLFKIDVELNELIHRLFVVASFMLIVWGLFRMRRAFED